MCSEKRSAGPAFFSAFLEHPAPADQLDAVLILSLEPDEIEGAARPAARLWACAAGPAAGRTLAACGSCWARPHRHGVISSSGRASARSTGSFVGSGISRERARQRSLEVGVTERRRRFLILAPVLEPALHKGIVQDVLTAPLTPDVIISLGQRFGLGATFVLEDDAAVAP